MAQVAQQPQMYLDILIEDCQSWEETLAYLQSLPRQEAAAALQKYGKARPRPSHCRSTLECCMPFCNY